MTSPVRAVDLDATPVGPQDVVLALGSNLGDRAATLAAALVDLRAVPGLRVAKVSAVVETDPVGGPEQGAYLNAVVVATTTLSPHDLLTFAQGVETAHGRIRQPDGSAPTRWGARTLDIDIIVVGQLVSRSQRLQLPHPRAHERAFVLVPWAALEPDAVLPGPGGGPVAELASVAPDRAGVRPTEVLIS